ncbi:MAG: hypothetical protein HRU20_13610 [Pseudomonadales bacterium]|nr:hypothetical protein [Pseudomonadales bacterium]
MNIHKKPSALISKRAIFTLSTLGLAIHSASLFAEIQTIEVSQSDSGVVSSSSISTPSAPSRYTGNRTHMKLMYDWPWNESDPQKDFAGFRPGDYHIYVVNNNGVKQDEVQYSKSHIANTSDTNWNATLEKHTPFNVRASGKQVGLYMGEWGSWERAYPSEMIAANNITHLYYAFVGICDYQRNGANGNSGLDSEFGVNSRNGKTMKAACGQALAPNYTETRTADLVQLGLTDKKNDFEISSYDFIAFPHHIDAIKQMKQQAPHLKAMLSIGGWTLSDPFYDMANDANYRRIFVNSVVDFVRQEGVFDGIDIDWEFPGGSGATKGLSYGYEKDRDNFTALIKELRRELTANFGEQFELSAALSASPSKLASIDLNALKDDFTFINLMTYDLYGAWGKDPGHHAAAYSKPVASAYNEGGGDIVSDEQGQTILVDGDQKSTTDILRGYSAEGAIEAIKTMYPQFSLQKLNIGVASYSRGWQAVKVKELHDKLFWHGQAQKHQDGYGMAGTFQVGVSDFRDVYDHNMTGSAANLYYDNQAKAAYTWKESSRSGGYVTATVESFDSPRSVIDKGELMKKYGLGGVFAWEAQTDNGLILNAMNAVVCNPLTNGGYYSFEQNYGGSVDTQVRGIDQNGQPMSVEETLQEAHTYRFDGTKYCTGASSTSNSNDSSGNGSNSNDSANNNANDSSGNGSNSNDSANNNANDNSSNTPDDNAEVTQNDQQDSAKKSGGSTAPIMFVLLALLGALRRRL